MKFLPVILFVVLVASCSRDIPVEPIGESTQTLLNPDYNFLSTPAFDVVYKNEDSRYVMPVQLYLRPFENVSDSTQFILLYDSDKYAQLLVLSDTLFPGDKKRIMYDQFVDNRIVAVYSTQTSGNHNVQLSMSAGQVAKDSNFQLKAN